MRILHIVHSLVPGAYRGGISKVAHELAAAQVQLGHEVGVVATNLNSGRPVGIAAGQAAEIDGCQVRYFAARGHRSADLRSWLMSEAGPWDVLHAHNPLSPLNCYARQAAQRHGRPLFVHLHGALNPYGQQSRYRRLRRAAYVRLVERRNLQAAHGLFALSTHEASHAERQIGGGNTILLPNGTSLCDARGRARPERFRRQFSLEEDRRVVLFVGRICDIKGVHLLVEAFAELARRRPLLHLVIAGSREQFPAYVRRLDELVRRSALPAQRITWTGFLNEQQKIDALAAAEVFCHPSESEGMPMSVLEAMAMKLPCLIGEGCFMSEAADAGAVEECKFSAASVRQGLGQLLDDVPRRAQLARRAAEHAARHHSWPAIAESVVANYREAVSQSRRAA